MLQEPAALWQGEPVCRASSSQTLMLSVAQTELEWECFAGGTFFAFYLRVEVLKQTHSAPSVPAQLGKVLWRWKLLLRRPWGRAEACSPAKKQQNRDVPTRHQILTWARDGSQGLPFLDDELSGKQSPENMPGSRQAYGLTVVERPWIYVFWWEPCISGNLSRTDVSLWSTAGLASLPENGAVSPSIPQEFRLPRGLCCTPAPDHPSINCTIGLLVTPNSEHSQYEHNLW